VHYLLLKDIGYYFNNAISSSILVLDDQERGKDLNKTRTKFCKDYFKNILEGFRQDGFNFICAIGNLLNVNGLRYFTDNDKKKVEDIKHLIQVFEKILANEQVPSGQLKNGKLIVSNFQRMFY
jgi:hypothetical protein